MGKLTDRVTQVTYTLASATTRGLVGIDAQTFAGAKTFTSDISAPNLNLDQGVTRQVNGRQLYMTSTGVISATDRPWLTLASNGTAKAYMALAGAADDWIVGATSDDLILRTNGEPFLISTDSGATEHFSISSSGVSRFGGPYVSFAGNGYIRQEVASTFRFQCGTNGYEFRNSSNGSTRMSLSDTGNMVVEGSVTAGSTINIDNASYSTLNFRDGSDVVQGQIQYEMSSDKFYFTGARGANTSVDMTFDGANRRLGIGTTSPGFPLVVVGADSNKKCEITNNGQVHVSTNANDNAVLLDINNSGHSNRMIYTRNATVVADTWKTVEHTADYDGTPKTLYTQRGDGITFMTNRSGSTTTSVVYLNAINNGNQQQFLRCGVSLGDNGTSATSVGGLRRNLTNSSIEFYTGASDRRAKIVTGDMEPMLDKLRQVALRTFDFKSDDLGSGVGPIAQELYEIFPDKVIVTDDGLGDDVPEGTEPWAVSSTWDLELLKAVQELADKLDAAEARIAVLEGN